MDLLDRINTLNTWAGYCGGLLYDLEDGIDTRSVSAYNLSAHGGIGYIVFSLKDVLYDLIEAMQYFVYGQTSPYDYVYWFNVHKGLYDKEVDVSWPNIILAYLDAEDNERSAWQLLVDAYQASMYDKPFDLEYHKNWVRRFKEWR